MKGDNTTKEPLTNELKELRRRITQFEHSQVERKRSEEALRKSEERYRTLVEDMPALVCRFLLDGTLTFVNSSYCEYFNKNSEDLIGENFFQFVPQEDREKVTNHYQSLTHDRPMVTYEHQVITPNGEIRWQRWTDRALFDGQGNLSEYQSMGFDITEHRHAEQALRESEEKFRVIAASAQDAIIVMDNEGNVSYWNDAAERIFGYSSDEIIGKELHTVLGSKRFHEAYQRAFPEFQVSGKGNAVGKIIELAAVRKDGTEFPIELSVSSVYLKGKWSAIGIVRDISERKRLEAQLLQAQKMEAIGTLAGGIAHDFNNVLMGIQGHASLALLYAESNRPHSEHIKAIEDMVRRGADLAKQLLGFARGGKYEVRPADLNEIIKKSSDLFGRTKTEIKIHRKYQKDIWLVEVDQGQIEQVLLNLYVNAWHAMPDGRDLYIETSHVVLDDKFTKAFGVESGNYVKISVTDTGVGMDEVIRQRIFDPFFTTKEMGRGTGLGLASVYGIIKNHDGIINVYSEKGKGTTFDIYLPASGKEITRSEKEITIKEEGLVDDILKGTETVLLVDDEDMILHVGKGMLKEMGYKVLLARGGKEAIHVYRKHKDHINLVVLDMIMPDIGGGDVYDSLKEVNPDIKVLLSTGYSINGQATEILKRGCDGFIQKPFNMKELSEKIREILDRKQA